MDMILFWVAIWLVGIIVFGGLFIGAAAVIGSLIIVVREYLTNRSSNPREKKPRYPVPGHENVFPTISSDVAAALGYTKISKPTQVRNAGFSNCCELESPGSKLPGKAHNR